MATTGEAREIADAGAQGGGRDEADTGRDHQALAAGVALGDFGELLLDGIHRVLAGRDLIEPTGQGLAQRHREIVVAILQCGQHARPYLVGSCRNNKPELPQQAAHPIDRSGALSLVVLADAMQPLCALLLRRLHRHRANIATACRFQQTGGISAISLIAAHVGSDMLGGEQDDRMAGAGKANALQ